MKKLLMVVALSATSSAALPAEMVFQFNSPAFSGIGYSSHVMTIYNQELSRKLAVAAEKKAEDLKKEQDAQNTPMAKFIANLESRVYNELARQITEKLFEGQGTQMSGSFNFNGGNISYTSSGGVITMTITDDRGNVTTVTVPVGDFGWIAP
jgi:hypothetical protein